MSVEYEDFGSVPGAPGALCWCIATSLPSPTGEVIVLRVEGEIDLSSLPVLRAALTAALERRSGHVVVDLAEMGFCSVRGLAVLAGAGAVAAAQGTGYAIGAASRSADRLWAMGWPGSEAPIRFPTAGDGVLAAMARRPAVPS